MQLSRRRLFLSGLASAVLAAKPRKILPGGFAWIDTKLPVYPLPLKIMECQRCTSRAPWKAVFPNIRWHQEMEMTWVFQIPVYDFRGRSCSTWEPLEGYEYRRWSIGPNNPVLVEGEATYLNGREEMPPIRLTNDFLGHGRRQIQAKKVVSIAGKTVPGNCICKDPRVGYSEMVVEAFAGIYPEDGRVAMIVEPKMRGQWGEPNKPLCGLYQQMLWDTRTGEEVFRAQPVFSLDYIPMWPIGKEFVLAVTADADLCHKVPWAVIDLRPLDPSRPHELQKRERAK
jgi:hypothetical protein